MFGSILAMKQSDVILSVCLFGFGFSYVSADSFFVCLSIILVVLYIVFYNRLFLISFDEKFAKASGISVSFYQFLIALITALVVVLGMRMMGTLLISSLIVFPAIISKKLTNSFKGLVIMSSITSIICFLAGILVSFYINLPAGASIVLVYMILLVIVNILKSLFRI